MFQGSFEALTAKLGIKLSTVFPTYLIMKQSDPTLTWLVESDPTLRGKDQSEKRSIPRPVLFTSEFSSFGHSGVYHVKITIHSTELWYSKIRLDARTRQRLQTKSWSSYHFAVHNTKSRDRDKLFNKTVLKVEF